MLFRSKLRQEYEGQIKRIEAESRERIQTAVAEGQRVAAEIREIAHRVTVLRDGRVRGSGLVGEISDQELLTMIVGRALGSTFPPKAAAVSPHPLGGRASSTRPTGRFRQRAAPIALGGRGPTNDRINCFH